MSLTTDTPHSFLPFCNDPHPPRSRQLSASIWAPQSTQPETSWPKAPDNVSRGVQHERRPAPQLHRAPYFPITREDVFGPIGSQNARQMGVGAIGEGRKKNSPTLEDSVRVFSLFLLLHRLMTRRHSTLSSFFECLILALLRLQVLLGRAQSHLVSTHLSTRLEALLKTFRPCPRLRHFLHLPIFLQHGLLILNFTLLTTRIHPHFLHLHLFITPYLMYTTTTR